MIKLRELMPWLYGIFGINLVVILVTAVFPYVHDGFFKWNILHHLNLAEEMNLAAWWSGSLLLLCGVIAYQLSNWDVGSKHAWTVIVLLFSFLSFDEISSIHERVGNLRIGLAAYIIIALIAGLALMFASRILWKNKHNRRGLVFLLVGTALLASAAPNEYLEHHLDWASYLVGPRVAFEEGLEISGILICLIGIASYQPADKLQRSILGFIPGFQQLTNIKKVLLAGFVLHIGIAWIAVHYIEIGFRGDPAVWYFTAVFYLLASSYILKAKSERPFIYVLVSVYFLALSAGSMYFPSPHLKSKLHDLWVFDIPVVMLPSSQLILIFMFYFLLLQKVSRGVVIQFLAITIALGLGWYFDGQFIRYVMSGLYALIVAFLFLPKEEGLLSSRTISVWLRFQIRHISKAVSTARRHDRQSR